MKLKKCPRCGTENLDSLKFCQSCDYPLKGKEKSFTSTLAYLFLISIFILFILSISAFAYLEIRHPEFGLKSRLKAVYRIMTAKNWKQYNKNYTNPPINKKIDKLKDKKQKLENEINSRSKILIELNERIKVANETLKRNTELIKKDEKK